MVLVEYTHGRFIFSPDPDFKYGNKWKITVHFEKMSETDVLLGDLNGLTEQFAVELEQKVKELGFKNAFAFMPTGWVGIGWEPVENSQLHKYVIK